MISRYAFGLTLAGCLATGIPVAKATLLGASVTGTLNFASDTTNYFDPANGYALAMAENNAGLPVTISATATEFGFQDAFSTITADLTATRLTFTDAIQGGSVGLSATITSLTPGAFVGLSLASTNSTGLIYSLSGDTISLVLPSFSSDGTLTATFDIVSAVPEPISLATLGVGLAALVASSASTRGRRPRHGATAAD